MKNVFFLTIVAFSFSFSSHNLVGSTEQTSNFVAQENEACKKVIVVDDILGIELETDVCEPTKALRNVLS